MVFLLARINNSILDLNPNLIFKLSVTVFVSLPYILFFDQLDDGSDGLNDEPDVH